MCCSCQNDGINRREFMGATAAGVAGMTLLSASAQSAPHMWDPAKPMLRTGKPLTVQPILLYQISQRREQTSWRPWGAIHTEQDAQEEAQRITAELETLKKNADFELTILPLVTVSSIEQADRVCEATNYDVPIVYAASGWTGLLEACYSDKRSNLMFLRHRSGPIYLWYEIVHNRFLRQGSKDSNLDEYRYPGGMDIYDVVVDEYDDVLLKLRALYGVHNFLGRKVVALGGSSGWCNPDAPEISREKFGLDIVHVDYADLEQRIKKARADRGKIKAAEEATQTYLQLANTTLRTDKQFVINGFLLYDVMRDYLKEQDAAIFTILECMSTVIPISETTACLPLSLLNDEGYVAFCESDFNAIPAGILLHYISGKPVFFNDPTFPHHGLVTCAHCTAPRRMDGENYATAHVVTHFESDYGATPKVELPIDTPLTMVCPDGDQKAWVGFTGTVIDNPFYDICRSQYDIKIDGNWKQLLRDHRGFHWLMACGNYSEELAHACRKIDIEWENVSESV